MLKQKQWTAQPVGYNGLARTRHRVKGKNGSYHWSKWSKWHSYNGSIKLIKKVTVKKGKCSASWDEIKTESWRNQKTGVSYQRQTKTTAVKLQFFKKNTFTKVGSHNLDYI